MRGECGAFFRNEKTKFHLLCSGESSRKHTASELSPGSIIVHDKLGRGTVVKIDSLSGEDTITVDFGVIGIKKLLLKFAKFSIVKNSR